MATHEDVREASTTMNDIEQQSEMLVMDYLRSSRCMKTMDALSKWITDKAKKSHRAKSTSEIFNNDVAAYKESSGKSSSVLEYMIGMRKQSKLSCISPDVQVAEKKEWTSEDIALLKKAAKNTANISDKTERWKNVGSVLGRSKRDCYEKYKELKKERKVKVGNVAVAKPSKEKTKIKKVEKEELKLSQPWIEPKKLLSQRQGASVVPEATTLSMVSKSNKYEAVTVIEDCDDFDTTFEQTAPSKISSVPTRSGTTAQGKLINSSDAASIRKLLFSDPKMRLSAHWTDQGFSFAKDKNLKFGIIQLEGGPCGVMAVVQAYTLNYLTQDSNIDWQNPTTDQQNMALTRALTQIIWQAGSGKGCTVALQGQTKTIESLLLSTLTSQAQARDFIQTNLTQFMNEKGYGVVLLVVSVILSRGTLVVQGDMDAPTGVPSTLVGAHDYCTQEIVNLLLVGYASSNVFDGNQDLGSESDKMLLRGIQKQGTVGFLTLFEAYEYMVVGQHLKQPYIDIWVICSESHYSVLFGDPKKRITTGDKSFDLFYFDGLANQDELIRLTIDPNGLEEPMKPNHNDKTLVPPLDLVIRTKWSLATIDWNGTEPLL
ncbi:hypothetical protein THRCLA_09511 [Thraustotheca clavata]|uniref:Myb-like domain-containing protein n=1 Tax=Thraustotheca clavata TaxID=74557 RepID=A0A1V9YW22_9STRA|nr:hypothetical protein THRCLA_09511 [Thraustotheca clavata]